jgi:hypothetical protein
LDPHWLFDILSLLFTFGAGIAGLAIKAALSDVKENQATVKAELVKSQTEMNLNMNMKHAENRQDIATHAARDEEQFKAINNTLDRIEDKIDRANGFK